MPAGYRRSSSVPTRDVAPNDCMSTAPGSKIQPRPTESAFELLGDARVSQRAPVRGQADQDRYGRSAAPLAFEPLDPGERLQPAGRAVSVLAVRTLSRLPVKPRCRRGWARLSRA